MSNGSTRQIGLAIPNRLNEIKPSEWVPSGKALWYWSGRLTRTSLRNEQPPRGAITTGQGTSMAEQDKPNETPDEPPISDFHLTEPGAISDAQLRKAEEFIEQEERASNKLTGWAATIATAIP